MNNMEIVCAWGAKKTYIPVPTVPASVQPAPMQPVPVQAPMQPVSVPAPIQPAPVGTAATVWEALMNANKRATPSYIPPTDDELTSLNNEVDVKQIVDNHTTTTPTKTNTKTKKKTVRKKTVHTTKTPVDQGLIAQPNYMSDVDGTMSGESDDDDAQVPHHEKPMARCIINDQTLIGRLASAIQCLESDLYVVSKNGDQKCTIAIKNSCTDPSLQHCRIANHSHDDNHVVFIHDYDQEDRIRQ